MRKCLKCQKDISGKHESAKFCSTSCRVMWNRKHGNQNKIKPVQVQVLFNQMVEMMDNFKTANPEFKGILPHQNGLPTTISHATKQNLGIEKSFQQFMNAIPDLQYEDEFRKMSMEIEGATNLSDKQKTLLLINLRKPNI